MNNLMLNNEEKKVSFAFRYIHVVNYSLNLMIILINKSYLVDSQL
jgi:hypothetical protein